ncbi:NDP-sugar epimerase, includes UDP-GlcNAc-inverting 4,6-dehydratase FlaA1 and capsular polysaccharide biosynthesis protein EpsC [Polaromonas sp. OV174]|uniref:polysaccharide biosynthesis protein n=1 Tax=Polaromonas sp. OV174 TaxID=1855300 RepID=UPI0008ED3190|nr:nucleoside-diphosphate sugar epimerase/dehydratase [Polaromonas sp. OV174]SFB66827.1 NDP-sugar epimerase, includes UDP-GlcNAc-inverting 4,6-dehydratase FlaA1 and capsular polysaccharide biosynthesis protein EpsC [Polaromonas sp. OV174]
MSFNKSLVDPLLALPRSIKRLMVVTLDLALALVSVWLAFYLRIDQTGWPQLQQKYVYLLAPLLAFPLFARFGLYRAIFRYTGLAALATTAKAVGVYGVLLFIALLLFKWGGVPRSVGLIQPILFLLLVGTSRALARFWLAGGPGKSRQAEGRLLIYGAGEAGVQTASALGMTRQFVLRGFIDDDRAKAGRSINGVDIIGPDDVAAAVERMGVTDILLAMPSLDRARRNEIIASLRELPVHVRTLPGMGDLASGRVTVQDFQELDVEDLLGRAPVPPDSTLLARNLAGKTVLVTGAGGSIGGELCRQIILENPRQLVLVEHNEFGLYTIHRELEGLCAEHRLPVNVVPLLASVGNFGRLKEICLLYRPVTVYHAAAYKHVPLVESNPAEGVLNNVFGTLNMARAAMESEAAHFVLVSTDKAVRPTNVMGATKRMAELVLQALAATTSVRFHLPDGTQSAEFRNNTVFSMVRFGNVLGSSGSVVPLFRKQLRDGGPLTVTHEEVTRYFMTIPEAAQLVLQAGAMARGGDVFVLDMGQPVKIIDLARRMAQLSGFTLRDERNPEGDIEIRITGLRPGEKLYEELLIGDNPESTANERIMKAREEFLAWSELAPLLVGMRQAAIQDDVAVIKRILMQLVQGYNQQLAKTDETRFSVDV